MEIGSGPAAVNGDEIRVQATAPPEAEREGAESRAIREPEDLPDRPETGHGCMPWVSKRKDQAKPGAILRAASSKDFFFGERTAHPFPGTTLLIVSFNP